MNDNYVRDLFDPCVGTLDVILYAVLAMLDMDPARIGPSGDTGALSLDSRCAANARKFLSIYPPHDSKIRGVKAIRDVSGLGLRDALGAYNQTVESYGDLTAINLAGAKDAASRGDLDTVRYYLDKL
jgi:hypothetical protein